MAEYIEKTDTLNEGREKLNEGIKASERAEGKSNQAVSTAQQAVNTASTAETKADSVQQQFNNVVIEGDSSVEAAQARVKEDGSTFDTLRDRLNSSDSQLAQTDKKLIGTVNIKSYEHYKVGDDWTPAWEQLILDAPEGYKIIFPTDTYVGNFISTKSYELDLQDSLLIPALPDAPVIKFEGSIGEIYSVVGHPTYGNLGFAVTDATGLNVGDVGYLVDAAVRPTDGTVDVNVELVKIKSIVGNFISVYDMIRSDQNTGSVRFIKVNTIKSPRIKNINVRPSDDHTMPAIYYYACENVISENVEIENNTGHGIRHELVYGWFADNPRIIEPFNTGSGSGYGLTAHRSRVGIAHNIYGRGTRHLIDFSSAYNCKAVIVDEENGKSSVVVLAHNGYGGNNGVRDVTCVTDSYAVNWSSQGVANRDLQVMRDVSIENIKHTVPTLKSNESLVSVNLQADYANLLIDAVRVILSDRSAAPSTASQAVRLSGNLLGLAKVENIMCNDIGAAVWTDVRSTKGRANYELIVDNISVDNTVDAVRLRGVYNSKIDNIAVNNAGNAIKAESFNGVTPYMISIGDNILVSNGEIFTGDGLTSEGLRGKPPLLTNKSNIGLVVLDGDTIPMAKILDSGGYLPIVAEVSKDTTLNALTPIDPPLWLGQEIILVINSMGDTGARGNIIIPSGSNTYAGGITLSKGNIYKLIGYNGKWKVIN